MMQTPEVFKERQGVLGVLVGEGVLVGVGVTVGVAVVVGVGVGFLATIGRYWVDCREARATTTTLMASIAARIHLSDLDILKISLFGWTIGITNWLVWSNQVTRLPVYEAVFCTAAKPFFLMRKGTTGQIYLSSVNTFNIPAAYTARRTLLQPYYNITLNH
jgi:hypothetical protein